MAAALVAEHGPREAWHWAIGQALDAHLARDMAALAYWKSIQLALSKLAPVPGPDDLDIYRTAKLLIDAHGGREAARIVWQRGVEMGDDLMGRATWARIADAVTALSSDGPHEDQMLH